MNKTIIINISGIVFHIEEDAYEVLRSYMIDVKKHFGHSVDSLEIVGDIENRIAEMFSERIVVGKKEVITMRDVHEVIQVMGRVSEFEDTDADAANTPGAGRPHREDGEFTYEESDQTVRRKLFRDPDDRVLGGVCSGLGHYFGIDSRWVRLILIILFITMGVGLLLYIILWLILPKARTRADRMAMRGEAPNLQNFKRNFDEEMEGLRTNFTAAGGTTRSAFRTAGNILARVLIIIVKAIGILLILSLCAGLITLLLALLASVGLIGFQHSFHLIPPNSVDQQTLNTLMISGLFVVSIPLVALIALIVRILFNRRFIGRYAGFALLAVWLISLGTALFHIAETSKDFRHESTLVEEQTLERSPVYRLSLNDLRRIKLDDNLDVQERSAFIRRTASSRNGFSHSATNRSMNYGGISISFQQIDSLEAPSITREYTARGKTFELASERAGKIEHEVKQTGERIQIDSHFDMGMDVPTRRHHVRIQLNIPTGTIVYIHRELNPLLRRLSYHTCTDHYRAQNGEYPVETVWIMTNTGLRCLAN